MTLRFSHLLFLNGLACTDVTKPVDTATPFESSITGPYVPGLFQSVCDPEVGGRLSWEIAITNGQVLDSISSTEGPIEISGHVSPLSDSSEVFYNNGEDSIQGFPQAYSLYGEAGDWNFGCVGQYIYAPRSDTDSTLDLYAGVFVVYLDLGEPTLKWTIVWTSSLGIEVPPLVAWNVNGEEWEWYIEDSSGTGSPMPDLNRALEVLAAAAVAAEEVPVSCPSGTATAENCSLLE